MEGGSGGARRLDPDPDLPWDQGLGRAHDREPQGCVMAMGVAIAVTTLSLGAVIGAVTIAICAAGRSN